jgi:hypothetical protein
MRNLSNVVVLVALPLATACCAAPNRPASAFPTADDALARMHATYACANGIRGDAKIDHRSARQDRIRGEVLLFAVNPALVRFDVVSPLGANLATLTSDGRTFEMFDMKNKQFLFGPAKACNLSRLTQVPIPGHALVSLLRGEAPVLTHDASQATIAWDAKNGFYQLVIASKNAATERIQLAVHPDDVNKPWNQQRIRVGDVLVTQSGVDLYHVEMKNYEGTHSDGPRVDPDGIDPPVAPSGGPCEAEVPRSIRMRVPNTEEDVIFQYKEAHWNPPILKNAFSQPEPGGVTRQFSDCNDVSP